LGASAQLVFLFVDADLVSGQECVARIRESFPKAHVFGCGTGGEIQGTRVSDGTLALTAVAFGHSHVAVAKVTIASIDQSAAAGEQLVRQLDPLGLRHDQRAMGGKEAVEALIALDPTVRALVTSGHSDDLVMQSYADYGFRVLSPNPSTANPCSTNSRAFWGNSGDFAFHRARGEDAGGFPVRADWRTFDMTYAKFFAVASLSLAACKGGGPSFADKIALGRSCDLTVTPAGMSQGAYNTSASDCPSHLCLKPAVQTGATMPLGGTGATCSAECTQDSDCDGELRDPTNAADQRCAKGFACGVPFVKGPLCCKKLCVCKDFLGTAGAATPIACQGSGPASCAETTGSPSSVGLQTDIYITVAPNRLLDLVFMVDNSPSMAPKVAKMNAQFPKLIAALKDPNDGTLPDLRIAIIDSDLGTGGAYTSGSCGSKTLPDGTFSRYGDMGRFQMIGATACGVTSADATYLETKGNTGVNFAGDINTVFACLAGNLGTLGCGEEHPLQAFEFALVAGGLGAVSDAQHLMLRPNAYLGLVFLTDEDDCSAATNDGMFGDKPELRTESASLRCYTRSHVCNDTNLTTSPPGPGYPTTTAFSAPLSACRARTDACPNPTDGNGSTDTSVPTNCSPLKDYQRLASEIKGLKNDPDNQILVAGIFGWPLASDSVANATYKIDLIPNPNGADTAHPTVFDSWPVCYEPNHRPANANTYDPTAAGWGATAGLRNAAFVDEFGANGLKFSICEADFSASMKGIGDGIAQKLSNMCINYQLVDTDPNTPGLQPDCRVAYRTPQADPKDPTRITYVENPNSLPACPAGASAGNVATDCWQLANDLDKCPVNGQFLQVLRTAAEMAAGPLTPGTKVAMQCRTCPAQSGVVVPGC
jgi:hypothetical protein